MASSSRVSRSRAASVSPATSAICAPPGPHALEPDEGCSVGARPFPDAAPEVALAPQHLLAVRQSQLALADPGLRDHRQLHVGAHIRHADAVSEHPLAMEAPRPEARLHLAP